MAMSFWNVITSQSVVYARTPTKPQMLSFIVCQLIKIKEFLIQDWWLCSPGKNFPRDNNFFLKNQLKDSSHLVPHAQHSDNQ